MANLEQQARTHAVPEPRRPAAQVFGNLASDWGTAALRMLPPETAHNLGMWMLRKGLMDKLPVPKMQVYNTDLQTVVPGLGTLKHPIGLAAGFDKNCLAPFGFAR